MVPTESDKIRQNDAKTELTARQRRFIPLLVSCATYTEACEKGTLNRTTLYEWLRDPAFKAEVEERRDQIAEEAFGLLSHGLTKAVETLTGLLDDSDKRLRRFAAKDILDHYLRHKELADLEGRIEAIEERLAERA